ncbi:MAG: 50S ribosomal protein L19 [candidate division WOR-3 bacterium]|nr:MAG: 50S ribosomal protein L19 [candidate division WOR-3 bacterium]
MAKIAEIKPGDLVKVYTKIIEGDKERIAPFQGVVIQIKGRDGGRTFTVRKVSSGVGVERVFPLNSPMIAKIEVKKRGRVRRAKLTYLRHKKGRMMKIREAASKKPIEEIAQAPEEEQEEKPEEQTSEGAPGQASVEKV